ncbi:MAG TPA: FkbM family methyltransferase [Methanobacteriales archaeon]|jgi:methyltransferase, FkbM family|nr:MAG: Uncharacterized protein XD44_0230 [Methanobacteriaceae archaeon 41_258]HIH61189.1 FkbM family methyltransferase [Methanobacteriales archaeon]
MDVSGKVVVDIGAYVGDSSVYFILKGAKKVYAFEPYPSSYKLLLKVIKGNGLEGKIVPFNEALAKKLGETKLNEKYENPPSSDLKSSAEGKPIKLTTLKEIVERFNLKNACLKMDCEGCEYSILKTPKKTLKAFQEIIMDYHYGYKNLKEKLEKSGFKVKNRA